LSAFRKYSQITWLVIRFGC